jgi:hypothetical protein
MLEAITTRLDAMKGFAVSMPGAGRETTIEKICNKVKEQSLVLVIDNLF